MEGTPEETLRLIRSFAAQQEQNVLSWPVSIVSSLLGRAADLGANRSYVVKRVRDTANSYGWSISDRNNPVPADGQPAPEFERSPANPKQVAEALGLKDYHWTQNWSTLSGGEAQRMSISIALSLALPDATSGQSRVCVFLLDEPTSALDTQSAQAVERLVLLSKAYRHIAIVWITHSDEQAARVGQLCAKMKGRRVRVLQLS
jgi:ABC-type iron transport system FetAB ATPase subunit